MGLFGFGKKEPCPVCGAEVTGILASKIAGGKALCSHCDDLSCMPKAMLKTATPEFMREHLAFREEEVKTFAAMEHTYEFDYKGKTIWIVVDEGKRLIAVELAEWNSRGNPVILRYEDIIGYELYRGKKKMDDDKTPGKTYSHTLGTVAVNLLSDNSPGFTLKLKTKHKYFGDMVLDVCDPPYRKDKGKYDDDMNVIGYLFKCMARGEPFVLE